MRLHQIRQFLRLAADEVGGHEQLVVRVDEDVEDGAGERLRKLVLVGEASREVRHFR